jgi:hypothetical protein
MSHYTPAPTKAKPHVNPLVKIWVWRCADKDCRKVNECLGSEDGDIRVLPSGNELREPSFYKDKCETCRAPATRAACLLEVKLLHLADNKTDKGKGPTQEDVEMQG